MKISLNVSERVFALRLLNDFKGSLEKLAPILEDIQKFSITDEDWQSVERKIVKLADDSEQWNWNDEKAEPKEMEIGNGTVDYLKDTIEKKSKDGEFTLKDKAALSLKEKLEK